MKTGNYSGYTDKGYKRNKDTQNSDRLINGLVLSNKSAQTNNTISVKVKK